MRLWTWRSAPERPQVSKAYRWKWTILDKVGVGWGHFGCAQAIVPGFVQRRPEAMSFERGDLLPGDGGGAQSAEELPRDASEHGHLHPLSNPRHRGLGAVRPVQPAKRRGISEGLLGLDPKPSEGVGGHWDEVKETQRATFPGEGYLGALRLRDAPVRIESSSVQGSLLGQVGDDPVVGAWPGELPVLYESVSRAMPGESLREDLHEHGKAQPL